jgi:alcohol dehydrogenase
MTPELSTLNSANPEPIETKMQALYAKQYGTTDVLVHDNHFTKPTKRDDQVLVVIHSASLNPVDNAVRGGYLDGWHKFTFPLGIAMDFSGVIAEEDVSGTFKKGDRVYGKVPFYRPGVVAEFVAVEESLIVPIPTKFSFSDAASLPLIALTSIQVFNTAKLHKGQKVFITGGSGGIGPFAIQYAKNVLGLDVYAKAGEGSIDSLTKLGAKVYDYKKTEWEEQKDQYDFIYLNTREDAVKLIPLIKKGGAITSVSVNDLKTDKATFQFLLAKEDKNQLLDVNKYLESGLIKPNVSDQFTFDHAIDAIKLSESGRAKGKIIINIK